MRGFQHGLGRNRIFLPPPLSLVDGRPSLTLGFFIGNPAAFVAFLNMLGLALLLVRVAGFLLLLA